MKLLQIDPRTMIATVLCACGTLMYFATRDASSTNVLAQRCTSCSRVIDYPTDVPGAPGA